MCYAGYDEYERNINTGVNAKMMIGDKSVKFLNFDDVIIAKIPGRANFSTRFQGKDRAIYAFWQTERHLKGNETVFKVDRSQLRAANQNTQRVGPVDDVGGTAPVL
jgi:hypothetical protein